MTRASFANLTTGVGSGAAALELIAGATKGFYLRELQFSLAAATASIYGLGRPAAKGTTPASILFLPEESKDPSTMQAATALTWGVGPTAPTVFYKRVALSATVGDMATWYFDKLFVPATLTLVLWNLAANSAVNVNAVIDEVN